MQETQILPRESSEFWIFVSREIIFYELIEQVEKGNISKWLYSATQIFIVIIVSILISKELLIFLSLVQKRKFIRWIYVFISFNYTTRFSPFFRERNEFIWNSWKTIDFWKQIFDVHFKREIRFFKELLSFIWSSVTWRTLKRLDHEPI